LCYQVAIASVVACHDDSLKVTQTLQAEIVLYLDKDLPGPL